MNSKCIAIFNFGIFFIFTIFALGCRNEKLEKKPKNVESEEIWFNPSTRKNMGTVEVEDAIPREDFFSVPKAEVESAINLLNDKAVISLTKNRALQFMGEKDKVEKINNLTKKSLKPFLVRALTRNEFTGGYNIYLKKESLWVSGVSIGKGYPHMKKQALVVFLRKRPLRVFVSCQSAY